MPSLGLALPFEHYLLGVRQGLGLEVFVGFWEHMDQ